MIFKNNGLLLYSQQLSDRSHYQAHPPLKMQIFFGDTVLLRSQNVDMFLLVNVKTLHKKKLNFLKFFFLIDTNEKLPLKSYGQKI